MNDLPVGEGAPVEGIAPSALWNLLGIPDEAPSSERVRLLLQQLDHADYLAPPAWYDALEVLADGNPDCERGTWLSRPALTREFEDRLRTEIDQLATRFWNIPPAERLSRWNGLVQRSRCWPSLRARLALLEPGLSLDSIAIDDTADDHVTRIAKSIAQMFPLDAVSRSRSIGEVLGSMIDNPHAWENAAHHLSCDRPEIALLVPEFLTAVTTLCDHEREENLRYEARNRETAEDAEWETQNLGDYLKMLRGDRAQYWLCGIFGGIPLLALVFAAIFELFSASATKQPPRTSFPKDRTVNEPQDDPMRRTEQSLRNQNVPPHAASGGDSVE